MSVEFLEALRRAGQEEPGAVVADGEIHRYGPKGALWYWLASDGSHGAFGDWRLGASHGYVAGDRYKRPSREERWRREAAQKALRERKTAEQRAAAQQARACWETLAVAGKSAYLARKQVPGYGVRYDGKAVVVPLRDADGALWSLQHIHPDGSKIFYRGGRVKGCFHTIGSLAGAPHAFIAEGYSTAATVHLATGQPVAVVFNAGNLDPVMAAVRKKHRKLALTIAADDDCWRPEAGNPGREKAEAAARKYGGAALFPQFFDTVKSQHRPTDWNDLHVLQGLEDVRRQLAQPPGKPLPGREI